MKRREVRFLPLAEDDLARLYDSISAAAGVDVATAYLDRIEAACMGLGVFPKRGMRRDDIRAGVRVLGFERRAAIVFRVAGPTVVICRILYGGRNVERILGDMERP